MGLREYLSKLNGGKVVSSYSIKEENRPVRLVSVDIRLIESGQRVSAEIIKKRDYEKG